MINVKVERWVEFAIAFLTTFARVVARVYVVGFRRLKAYDYVAVLVLVCFLSQSTLRLFCIDRLVVYLSRLLCYTGS